MLKDTFDFVNRVSKIEMVEGDFIVSFDVESLFTNIPVVETVDIIVKRAFPGRTKKFHGFDKETLKELLLICTTESHFVFNDFFYDQIDGVSMGSPLGPSFANFFIDALENKIMSKLRRLGVKTWLRFVDDTFVVLKGKELVDGVMSFLNEQHKNIRFTVETESNKSIPFLDTRVKVNKDLKLTTTLYHKKTFTGTYLNWTSLTDRKYKIGLIYCLLDRIWKICSDQEERDFEVSKLKVILAKNDYPKAIIEKETEKFLKNRTKIRTTAPQTETNKKAVKYLVLPFVNNKVIDYGKRLRNFIESNFADLELKVVFVAPLEMRNLFKFKDKVTDKFKQSLVVYRINCSNCKSFYIGKTERILGNRLKEHSRKPTAKTPNPNAPYKHSVETGHIINYEDIEIIDRADSNFKLCIKETLHIIESKPDLNTLCKNEFDLKTLIF